MSNLSFSPDPNKPFDRFDELYTEWSRYVTVNCLPLLRQPPLSGSNDFVLSQINTYYEALNRYARPETILHFLFPSWRSNSLETPILCLGDIDPHLLVSLVRAFLQQPDQDLSAWNDLSFVNLGKLEEIDRKNKEAVISLLSRMSEARYKFVDGFLDKWVSTFHSQKQRISVMDAAASVTVDQHHVAAMVDLVSIFVQANQLRMAAIKELLEVMNTNQAALFLEGLCEFYAGFKNQGQDSYKNSLFQNKPEPVQPILMDEDSLFHGFDEAFTVPDRIPTVPAPPPLATGMIHHHPRPTFPGMTYHHRLPVPSFNVPINNTAQPVLGFTVPVNYAAEPVRGFTVPVNYAAEPVIFVGNLALDVAEQQGQQPVDLFVGDLHPSVTPTILQDFFKRHYRSVTKARVMTRGGISRKFGFVTFANQGEQELALWQMNGEILFGTAIRTGPAQ